MVLRPKSIAQSLGDWRTCRRRTEGDSTVVENDLCWAALTRCFPHGFRYESIEYLATHISRYMAVRLDNEDVLLPAVGLPDVLAV